jgi:D-sedoheptulose 7-phosphate isomerase
MSGSIADYRAAFLAELNSVDLNQVQAFVDLLHKARSEGRTVFTAGNGGSAATASHFATDIGKGASYLQPTRFRVVALTDSISTITAYANDVSFDVVFAEQLTNLAQPGDILVTISGSGNSPNIIAAQQRARELGVVSVGMTGFQGGSSGPLADIHINVPSDHMGRIEDAHMSICHMVAFNFIDAEQHHSH